MEPSHPSSDTFGQVAVRCSMAIAVMLGLCLLVVALAACGKGPPEATPTAEPTILPPGALRGSVSYDGRLHDPAYILVQLYRSPALQPITATKFSVAGGEYAFAGLTEGDYYLQVWLNPPAMQAGHFRTT
jgi:hypothetical protein